MTNSSQSTSSWSRLPAGLALVSHQSREAGHKATIRGRRLLIPVLSGKRVSADCHGRGTTDWKEIPLRCEQRSKGLAALFVDDCVQWPLP